MADKPATTTRPQIGEELRTWRGDGTVDHIEYRHGECFAVVALAGGHTASVHVDRPEA